LDSSNEPAAALGDGLDKLKTPINAYFDLVLVNAEDEKLRNARLALVQHIAALTASIADLSRLQGF
jgi:glycyl-tRNA synthetase beta chain